MDKEFHYYINYLVALCAGYSTSESRIISYSAQYVDDNAKEFKIYDAHNRQYSNLISQTTDPSICTRKLEKIMLTFHFVPGDFQEHSNRKDGRHHQFCTFPNSFRAKLALRKALETRNLYLIGIASHAFCDTWSHQNFTGTFDEFNSIEGFPQRLVPNIGHADAFTQPDRMSLIWNDKRLLNPVIDNKKRFLDCAATLFTEYAQYQKAKYSVEYLLSNLTKIINKPQRRQVSFIDLQYRIRQKKYSELAHRISGAGIPHYNSSEWFIDAISSNFFKYKWRLDDYRNTHWFNFQEAVKEFYHYFPKKIEQLKVDKAIDKN